MSCIKSNVDQVYVIVVTVEEQEDVELKQLNNASWSMYSARPLQNNEPSSKRNEAS